MATYVPNAEQLTEPTSSRMVGSAAEEFRVLKTAVDVRADSLEADVDVLITDMSQAQDDIDVLQNQITAVGLGTDSVALAANLASTASGKGAALVGMRGAGTVQGWRDSQKTINLLDPKYGVVGDRLTNDTAAIQAALNDLSDGGALYIPKTGASSGVGPNYKVDTNTLILSANDVTIYSDHKSEYADGFYTTGTGWIIKVTGYGCRFQGVSFQGNGNATTFSTVDAILFDRTSLGDLETYSNRDAEVRDCGFLFIRDAVRGIGRNVFVFDNLFSHCKRGIVGELHTYSGGTLVSSFHGWRVSRNRCHSCGAPYLDPLSTEALPATLDLLDSWCIQMAQTSTNAFNLEIFDNHADFCGAGFYKGHLISAKISGNKVHGGHSIFVYANITDAAAANTSLSWTSSITDNLLTARTLNDITSRGAIFCSNFIYVKSCHHLTIDGNQMRGCMYEAIVSATSERLSVKSNYILNANNAFATDATTRPAIALTGGSNAQIYGNYVLSQVGTVYSAGVHALTSSPNIKLRGNTVLNSVTPYIIPVTNLAKAEDEGLPWQTPTMTNGYTYTSGYGYRRMFDGHVQISVLLATGTGTDNASAFTLPAGYRPAQDVYLPQVGMYAHVYAFIRASTGEVFLNWETTAPGSYSINCEFEAA